MSGPGQEFRWVRNGARSTLAAEVVCATASTELALEIWRTWDKLRREDAHLDELQSCGTSMEPGVVQPLYTHAGWIPLWSDPSRADYVGVDLAPGERGTPGQIINFGRDEEAHFSPARDLEELLDFLLAEVRSGRWRASEIWWCAARRSWSGSAGKWGSP